MAHHYSEEEKRWLIAQDRSIDYLELAISFNEKFGTDISKSAIQQMCVKKLGCPHYRQDYRHYTDEQKEWLMTQSPDISYKDLTKLFNEKFGANKNISQIQDLCGKRLKIHRSNNSGQYTVGARPKLNIGEEIIKGGYIWVKIDDVYYKQDGHYSYQENYRTNWKRKADIIWENARGEIPEKHFLIYLDKDPMNCTIENLYLIDRKIHAFMCSNNWYSTNPAKTMAALKCAELMTSIKEVKK